jgi:hypothetical protein
VTTPKRYDDDLSLATKVVRGIRRMPHGFRALLGSWRGIVIVLIVASQLLLPLHYYLARRDPHDERFAWRMFSPMRMTKCTPRFSIDNVPVDLRTQFHEAWIEVAKRGRFTVIEQMAARLCEKNPGTAVHVVVECRYVDTPDMTWGGYDMCKVPLL